jgi:hypothetical protein
MSDFLDGLARRMAEEPMTRSRALRVFGGAFLAAATPGILRAGPAHGLVRARSRRVAAGACASFDTPCGNRCCPRDTFCGNAATEACCGTGTTYCPKGSLNDETCCNPGETCNPAGGGCCAQGHEPCGKTCCYSDGDVCADARTGLCCTAGEEPCGTVCCEKGGTCARASTSHCCKKGEDPCHGPHGKLTCCNDQHACCEGKCCPKGTVCRGGKCKHCPKHHTPCGDDDCCPPDIRCCGGKCCFGADSACARAGGKKVCCDPARILTRRRGGAPRGGLYFCCPEGTVPRRGVCCPETGKCDRCDDETPCLPGTVCINGDCKAM